MRRLVPFAAALCLSASAAFADVTLFNDVRVFDGTSATLSGPVNVLVRDNVIERITTDPVPTDRMATTTLIDGAGRTLMPGLIDAHTHLVMSTLTISELTT